MENFAFTVPEPASARLALAEFCSTLPPLPSVLRYYDEFDDTIRSIRNPSSESIFSLVVRGKRHHLNFEESTPECAKIYKHMFAFLLAQGLNAGTVYTYIYYAQKLTADDILAVIQAGPVGISMVWKELRGRGFIVGTYCAVKSLLHLLCSLRFCGWSQDYQEYISKNLSMPARDSYAAVRAGDVFLSAEEEASIVRYLDDIVQHLKQKEDLTSVELANAGMLICAYQFAMRPVQIGMLDMRHVRIWQDDISSDPTVHLTFHMAKQRGNAKRIPLTRKVKREWTPIFVRLKEQLGSAEGNERFFQVNSSHEIGVRISTLTRSLIGCDDIGSATDLRHTAAQRLVDAGASHEELAEFMGHAQITTGLVYYATSASHAERVNKALGASDVYRRVAKIGHDKFISPEELVSLKSEQQIAAVPHGIPISGIGGCQSGQPRCPYNPITSCYGCHKFMPLRDKAIHESVLRDMREVVLFFEGSSRADVSSPAYMQLQRTIAEIQTVLDEFDGSSE